MKKLPVEGKQAFTRRFAAKRHISLADAHKDVDTFWSLVIDNAKHGKNTRFMGAGEFKLSHRKARKGRNPQTGKPMKIGAKNHLSFSDGNKTKKALNK